MKIIDGKLIAKEIRDNLHNIIIDENLKVGLAIIMVGNNAASEIYVRNKLRACSEVGIEAFLYQYDDISEDELIEKIKELNEDTRIHGIIVQSPLPSNINENVVMNYIALEKDVDGLSATSLGLLAVNQAPFLAATPAGIIKMLEYENIKISGKHIVIVGRSRIVGIPLYLALNNLGATVTMAHSKTENLIEFTRHADILVVAIGKANYITREYVGDGAVVIDVGTNYIDGVLVGDVDYQNVKDKVAYISPVPGGCGVVTVAMLLNNVVASAKSKKDKKEGKF